MTDLSIFDQGLTPDQIREQMADDQEKIDPSAQRLRRQIKGLQQDRDTLEGQLQQARQKLIEHEQRLQAIEGLVNL